MYFKSPYEFEVSQRPSCCTGDLGIWDGEHESPALEVMVTVPDRSAETLLPIMQRHLQSGTIVHSDSWAAYRNMQQLAPIVQHDMVNHFLNFIDPVIGAHTENVESYWNRVQEDEGVHQEMLTSYMDEFMWRELHGTGSSTVLANLCRDIVLRYPQQDTTHLFF